MAPKSACQHIGGALAFIPKAQTLPVPSKVLLRHSIVLYNFRTGCRVQTWRVSVDLKMVPFARQLLNLSDCGVQSNAPVNATSMLLGEYCRSK